MIKKWTNIFLVFILAVVLGGFQLFFAAEAADEYDMFVQSDWRGGASGSTASHPGDKNTWTRYYTKTANVVTSQLGGVSLSPVSYPITDTTAVDFGKGAMTNLEIQGTGSAANLVISAQYQDPFFSGLGEWANQPASPFLGRTSPLVLAGNYVFSLWQANDANKTFARWSIAQEKWELMADIPFSTGQGAALAFDGADVIYATVGGNRKEFYAYKISTNTWYPKANVPSVVSQGGALAVVPSVNRVFAFCGSNSTVFYRYSIPAQIDQAGTWTAVESSPFNVGIGASLVYPGSGIYIYASGGGGSTSFAKFNINASSNAWTNVANCPFNLTWDSDVVYPGAGEYLYAWEGNNRRFARYFIGGDSWESSYFPTSPVKNISMSSLPFVLNSRMMLYDPDGSGQELRLLSHHSYVSTYRYYPATKKWREESYPRTSGGWGRAAVYVASENAIYYVPGNGSKEFYKYFLTFNPVPSNNTAVVHQWERLSDASFSGNTSGINHSAGSLAYKTGDNYIYCMQGNAQDGFSRYNLTTKNWEQLDPLPQKYTEHGGSIAVAGNYVYATGGRDENESWRSNLYRYNISAGSWSTISNNPFGNFGYGSQLVYPEGSDYLYMLRNNNRSEFMRYQISTGTWERMANLPDMWIGYEGGMAYSSNENAIYFLNGHNEELYDGFARYDIATNIWQSLPLPVFADNQTALCASPDKLYNVGSSGSGLRGYDFVTAQWDNPLVYTSYNPSTKFVYGSTIFKDDYVYLFNNCRSGYAWKYSLSQKKWVELIRLPFVTQGYGHRAVYPGTGDYIYVSEGSLSKNFWKFNTVTGAWTQLNSSPYMFSCGAKMAADGSGIYVCPGAFNNLTFLKFVDDAEGGSWIALTSLLDSVSSEGNGMCIISSGPYRGIYLLRQNSDVKFSKYDLDNETWGALAAAPWTIQHFAFLMYPGTGDFLYCLKGSGRDFAKYSLSANTWTILTEASSSVDSCAGGFYPGSGDLLYFYLGRGRTGSGYLGVNLNRYSISQDKWDEPIVFPETSVEGAQICGMPSGEEVFFMRGNGSNCYKYNLTSSVWYTLQPTPAAVTNDAKAVYPGSGDYIYATRGVDNYDLWRYAVSTDSWTSLPAPPQTFAAGQVICCKDDYIYAIRGGSTTTFWQFNLDNSQWLDRASTPALCSRGANLVYPGAGNYLYATAGGSSSAFWKYDMTSNTWTTLTPLPMFNAGGVLFSPGFGDYLYFFVSYNYDGGYGTPFFYRYSIANNIWEARPNLNFCLNGQSSAVYPGAGDCVYLSGGYGTVSLMKYLLFSSGTFISDIKEIGNNAGFGSISWQDNALGQIDVKVRTGNTMTLSDAATWGYSSKVAKNSDLSGYSSVRDKDRYLQYYLRFFCYDLTQPPALDSLTLNYNKYSFQEDLTSSAYNTGSATNRLKQLSWTSTLPSGTDVRFQVRTSLDGSNWTPWLGPAGIQQIPYEFTTATDYAKTSEILVEGGKASLSKVLRDYLYRQKIVIDNTAGAQAYANSTIKIDIAETNIDFWQHVASDGADIRFADSDGQTPLNYRVVGFSKAKKSATCWITVPTIPQGATKDIYLLYGKSSAVSESNATLAESLIGTDFYGFMFGFFDIVTTDAPNRVNIEKLNNEGSVVGSTFLDFTAVGEKQRYDDTDLTTYHIYSEKPITIFSSSVEPTSYWDDDYYFVCGNDLWLWCPSNNYDGDVIITAYNDDTQVKITDYGKGDDTMTLVLDKGSFWIGMNKVDMRGEVWHIESTKPVTVMAGLINHEDASAQAVSPDMKEYYFYAPNTYVTVTAYEDVTSFTIDSMDSTTGDYSGMLNKGQSYKHIPVPPAGGSTMRVHLTSDKPVCVVVNDISSGKGQTYQSADYLVSLGRQYYLNTGPTRYVRLVSMEDGANSIDITGDINPSPTSVSLNAKGSSATIDLSGTYRNVQLSGTKKFAIYSYGTSSEAIVPVFHPAEFNYLMPVYSVALESPATSANPNLSGWLYKETIKIDNTQNDAALTDYQVFVSVDRNHKDFWAHCLANGGDVRFVDEDDTTLLNYYTDYFTPTEKKAGFWVKIPALPNTQQKTISMYYGKAGAVTQSNGANVFEFFDGFSDNLDQWNTNRCNLDTIASIFTPDSVAFNLPTGSNDVVTDLVIPSAVVSGRVYEWYWELYWANGTLVEAQSRANPFTLRNGLLSMTDGPFMIKKVSPGQVIGALGGTFTNSNTVPYAGVKYRFALTDASTGQTFTNIDSATFNIPVGTNTINNVSVILPADLVQGHLYTWSWSLLDTNSSVIFSSTSAPAPLFNIAVGFELTSGPVLPTPPLVGTETRQVTGTFLNTSGSTINNLYWHFTLTDTTQGSRTVAVVKSNGYIQSKTNLSPDYNIVAQIVWQTGDKTSRRFFGICDPNATGADGIGNASYLAGYDILLNSNGYFYNQSGNGFNTWSSQRSLYTATTWNTEKITWYPHDPSHGKIGKVVFELSSGDKLTYTAGFVAGPGLAIRPTVRSVTGTIYIDKFMVYKSATVKPYVGFVFSETANPTGMNVYYQTNPVIQPVLGVFYNNNLAAFQDLVTTPANTSVKYQVSSDGYNWYWWNASAWEKVSGGFSQSNTAADISAHLSGLVTAFPSGEFFYRAYLNSADGVSTPELDRVVVTTTTTPTYYLTPSGSLINYLNSDTVSDQWFQYKAFLNSYGQETPVLQDVRLEYLPAALTIVSPNGGESWPIGQTKSVTWTSRAIDEAASKVKIEYSTNSGNTWNLIVDNQTNTGAYDWQVPNNSSPSALIKITSKDFPSVSDTSDAVFGIMGLVVSSPNGGENWEIGSSHNITWSSFGTISNNLKIEYSRNGGGIWSLIADQQLNDGLYVWNIPSNESLAAANCFVRMSDSNNPNVIDQSDAVFAIMPIPAITLTSPNGAEAWKAGSTKPITWTNKGFVNPAVDVFYSTNSGAGWISLAPGVANTGTYECIVPDVITDTARIRVIESQIPARDTQVKLEDSSDADFSISLPSITITSPNSGEKWVRGDTHVITWTSEGQIGENSLLIEYSIDEGETWVLISQNEADDGSYSWVLPQEAVASRVKVRMTDVTRPQITDASDDYFEILDLPIVVLIQPNGGEKTTIGAAYEIRWFTIGQALENKLFDIYFSHNSGQTWSLVSDQQINDGAYTWLPPEFEIATARIKIACNDQNFPWVSDISDADFEIQRPQLTLTSPNGGESWYATGTYPLTWDSMGSIGLNAIKLEYSTDGGSTWHLIANNLANTHSYNWQVVDILTQRLKVKVSDESQPGIEDPSNGESSIIAPSITLMSPNGAELWVVGLEYPVIWTSIGTNNSIRNNLVLQYSPDNGSVWKNIISGISNNGTYTWHVANDISDHCLVRIYDFTRPATADASNNVFRIAAPSLTVVSPNGGEIWPYGTVKNITWTSVGQVSDDVNIAYSKNGGANWIAIYSGLTSDRRHAWTIPEDISPTCKIKVQDNNPPYISDITDSVFSITYPVIAVTRPNGGEIFVVTDTEVISWTSEGSVSNSLKIEYSRDNFVLDINEISDNVPNTGVYLWHVLEVLSTTMRIRITDNARLQVVDKSNVDFSVLPFPAVTIDAPNGGEIWRIGTKQNISWHDNGGPLSNNLRLEYSIDGGTNWKPVANGVANSGSYEWTVPDDYALSAKCRITDNQRQTTTDDSNNVFSIEIPRINITSPVATTFWAVGDSAPVTWTTEGTVGDNLLLQYSTDNFNSFFNVSVGEANDGSYIWTVPNEPTNNMKLRMVDGNRPAALAVSDPFTVLIYPQVTVISPNGGEEYVIGDNLGISWSSKGLNIQPLTIVYSPDNFVTTRTIASDVPNNGLYVWTIPNDALAVKTLKVKIYDAVRPVIADTSDNNFRIRGGFTVTYPTLNIEWGVSETRNITWQTRGLVPNIKLEYTLDNGTTWNSIVDSTANGNSYSWMAPDHHGSQARIRISDVADATINAVSEVFNIVYYRISWHVRDYDNMDELQNLSVRDGWWVDSSGTLICPVEHEYPYGHYTTFWSKEGYVERSMDWVADAHKSVTILLENMISAQIEWHVLISTAYNSDADDLKVSCWLERRGKLVGPNAIERADLTQAQVDIFDESVNIHSMVSVSSDEQGTFRFDWPDTGLAAGKTYFVKSTITFRNNTYTSGSAIDVTAAKKATEQSEQLSTIQAQAESIKHSVEQTIPQKVDSAKAEIKADTSKILTAAETAIPSQLNEVRDQVQTIMKSEILNRENSVRSGQKLAIRFRTYPGLQPSLDLYDSRNNQRITKAVMTENGATGIYEYVVEFRSGWGKGDYTVVCSESTKGVLDALIMTVGESDVDQVAGQVSAILGTTSGLNKFSDMAAQMSGQFAMIETVLNKIGKTSGSGIEGPVAGTKGTLDSVFDQIRIVAQQIKDISGNSSVNLSKLYDVSADKKNDLKYLKNKTQELKAMMEINKKMVNNLAHKPVTQTWYEYK